MSGRELANAMLLQECQPLSESTLLPTAKNLRNAEMGSSSAPAKGWGDQENAVEGVKGYSNQGNLGWIKVPNWEASFSTVF